MCRVIIFVAVLAQAVSGFILPIKLAAVSTTPPVSITTTSAPSKENAEVLTFQHNVWTTEVIIGGQVFQVAIDTMSSFLFVPDKSCSTSGCTGKDLYDSSKSSTYKSNGATFHENTLYGSIQGIIGNETIVLGENFTNHSITVTRATFGQATSIPGSLPSGVDGVLGLAFQSLAPRGTEPVFLTAVREKKVATGIFTLWLEDQYATKDNGTEGVIYYGDNDYLHCMVQQRHVYPLSNAQYFQFTIPSVSVGGYQYKQRTQTIIDSTSPYIAAPNLFVVNVLRNLGLPQNSQLPAPVPCDLQIDFAFNFALGTEHVNQLNLVYKEADGTCRLALIESPIGQRNDQFFELGIPFLRGRCTYFDVVQHQIGFGDPITHGPHFPPTTASPM